jgi:hypothetical protein
MRTIIGTGNYAIKSDKSIDYLYIAQIESSEVNELIYLDF